MALEIIIIAGLVLMGVVLFMAEIFLLPGITVAGIAGAIMLVGSIVYAFHFVGETAGFITIVANIVLSGGCFIYLIKSKALDRIALETNIDATVDLPELQHLRVGQQGIALSRLNPIGKAEFDKQYTIEAKSITGEFIDEGDSVKIVKVEKNCVLVELCKTDQ